MSGALRIGFVGSFICHSLGLSLGLHFSSLHKYEVVKVILSYADRLVDDEGNRSCTVTSEMEWLDLWGSAIRRAALTRIGVLMIHIEWKLWLRMREV